MKYISIFILFFILVSCTVSKNIVGIYKTSGKDFRYSLTLHKNKTFLLNEEFFDGSSGCKGTWHYLTNDTILLQCENEGVTAMLQSGYMSERNKKIIRLNRNQIKIENIVLIKEVAIP